MKINEQNSDPNSGNRPGGRKDGPFTKQKPVQLSNNQLEKITSKILKSINASNLIKNYVPEQSRGDIAKQYLSEATVEQAAAAKSISDNKLDKMLEAVVSLQNSLGPPKEREFSKLAASFLDQKDPKHAEVMDALEKLKRVDRPYEGFTNKSLGITFDQRKQDYSDLDQILFDIDKEKIGRYPTRGAYEYVMDTIKKEEPFKHMSSEQFAKLTHKKFVELIALDDWKDIWSSIKQAAVKYGKPALKMAWSDIVKPALTEAARGIAMGGDEGLIVEDNPNYTLAPKKYSRVPGLNYQAPGLNRDEYSNDMVSIKALKHKGVDLKGYRKESPYDFDAVSKDYIKAYIYPEGFTARKPTRAPSKTAVAYSSSQFTVTADASGNSAFYAFPQNCVNPPAVSAQSNAWITNPAAFNPQTGVANAYGLSSVGGFLYSSAAQINAFRMVGFAARIDMLTSNNSNGNVEWAYYQSPPNATLNPSAGATLPAISQQTLATIPGYQTGNGYSSYRMIRVPSDYDVDNQFTQINGQANIVNPTEGYYGLFTGFTANSNVAVVTMYFAYEFSPNPGALATSPIDYAGGGPRTDDFLTAMLSRYPLVQLLTVQDAKDLTSAIEAAGTFKYEALMDIVGESLCKIKFQPNKAIAGAGGYNFAGGLPMEEFKELSFDSG